MAYNTEHLMDIFVVRSAMKSKMIFQIPTLTTILEITAISIGLVAVGLGVYVLMELKA